MARRRDRDPRRRAVPADARPREAVSPAAAASGVVRAGAAARAGHALPLLRDPRTALGGDRAFSHLGGREVRRARRGARELPGRGDRGLGDDPRPGPVRHGLRGARPSAAPGNARRDGVDVPRPRRDDGRAPPRRAREGPRGGADSRQRVALPLHDGRRRAADVDERRARRCRLPEPAVGGRDRLARKGAREGMDRPHPPRGPGRSTAHPRGRRRGGTAVRPGVPAPHSLGRPLDALPGRSGARRGRSDPVLVRRGGRRPRPEDGSGGAAARARRGRGGESLQGSVPRDAVPRAAHAARLLCSR